MTLETLRQRHPTLRYTSFSWAVDEQGLVFSSTWQLEPDIIFTPEVRIHQITAEQLANTSEETLQGLAFYLGLIELPSYWKAACPARVIIEAGYLDETQLAWWKDLVIKGLGEFFFVNQIDFSAPDFLTLSSVATAPRVAAPLSIGKTSANHPKLLIPLGGGKDSLVTLDLLNSFLDQKNICLFILNEDKAAHTLAEATGLRVITATRKIDPKLLTLNQQGYLNGHTPFSAYLAFLSTITASLLGYNQVAVSNERSANEGNISFHGLTINHQYSKSFPFEKAFGQYAAAHLPLPSPVQYYSFLRPLYEVQIAKLFATHATTEQLTHFRSCNRGQKQNIWCEQCPKCLFAYTILYPFLTEEQLLKIFSHDLFEDEQLLETALELIGHGRHKPLECVGMYEESLVAFHLSYQKVKQAHKTPQFILSHIFEQYLSRTPDLDGLTSHILHGWNDEHQVPEPLANRLKTAALN